MRTFVFQDAKSHKFWNIELAGSKFTVTYGKVGTSGQVQTKEFDDDAEARKAHDKLVAEKVKKGYTETTPQNTTVSPLQQSMESAFAENPDDLATASAYADYLMEHNDPRGEFIQVQLALEDPTRKATERQQFQKREDELLKQNARRWIGGLGRFLVGKWSGADKPYHYAFRRGWVHHLRLLPAPEAVFPILAASPELRMLQHLEIVYDMRYHPFEFDQFLEGPNKALGEDTAEEQMYEETDLLPPLLESPHLGNLRVFKFGFSDGDKPVHSTMISIFDNNTAQDMIDFLAMCPKLEEFYLNTAISDIATLFSSPEFQNLRVLQYYYGSDYSDYNNNTRQTAYPLSALAENKSLTELTTLRLHAGRDTTLDLAEVEALVNTKNLPKLVHLQLHMTDYGNEGAARIVQSGILKRLRTLDLGYGNMNDEGARLLAECDDLRHLEMLNITRNALTQTGVTALQRTGVKLLSDNQHDAEEMEYLHMVDAE